MAEKASGRRGGTRRIARIDARTGHLTEDAYQADVTWLAQINGWLWYHTNDSRRSPPGFPDLVLVHPGMRRLIFAEVKGPKTTVRRNQRAWLWGMAKVGARLGFEVYVWRSGNDHLDQVGEVLRWKRTSTKRSS